MTIVDRMVEYVSPAAGLRRRAARSVLARYEAAEPSRHRKFYTNRASQNAVVQRDAVAIRTQVRHLARNHDLARGALRTLVNNVAGAHGIGIEPQPRRADGKIHKEYAADLTEAWRDFSRKPEVTHTLSLSRLQRAMARAWIRDGEAFGQFLQGPRPDLDHGTRVPLSLEVFESDLVPFDYNNESQRIAQGIQRNAWGRPTALHTYRSEPWKVSQVYGTVTRVIPWERVIHLAALDHIGQMRGISEFASVITRMEDIKDYEESERVAAKIAAMLTAYVKKGTPDLYSGSSSDDREINLSAGTIIDDLDVGEDIGMIDSKRPNPNVVTFRQGQLRATAAGIGGSYSSISKDYNGSFSSQRQELVEQWVNYAVLVDDFTGGLLQPVWERFVQIADLSGVVRRPRDVVAGSANDAMFVAQAMPWIDPLKEALGAEALVKAGFASELEMIRRRGANPKDLLDQVSGWRQECEERGVYFTTNEAALEAATLAASGETAE